MPRAIADMLQRGDALELTVTGSCMVPLLRAGQRLIVQKQKSYLTGDVLVFATAAGELLAHRYLGPAPDARLMTKADAGAKIDVLVLRDQVLGKVLTADGVTVAATAGNRVRSTLLYIGWLGKLLAGRLQRQNALRLPLD